jgi:SPP1 family predicted phage head-tail adaptor
MENGQLRHLILIEEYSASTNDFGEEVKTWITYKKTRAKISPFSGKEFMAAQSIQSEINTRMVVRFDSGIIPKMRISYRGVVYNIEAVLTDEKSLREYQTLLCSSGVVDN